MSLAPPCARACGALFAAFLLTACAARAADDPRPASRPASPASRTPSAPAGQTPASKTPPTPEGVNPVAHAQKAFMDRVSTYVQLRGQVEGKLPKLADGDQPEAIDAHKTSLRKALAAARKGAKPGDLFQPDTRALIRTLIADAARRDGPASRQAVEEENPGRQRVTVNGEYPAGQPVATVPPQILRALPQLPDQELEYRFMGRRLVLLDTRARLIVDYMENALP